MDDGPGQRDDQDTVLSLARGLLNLGHEALLICSPGSDLSQRAKSRDIQTREVAMRGEWDALEAWRIGSLAAEADVLHTFTPNTHSIALMAVRIGSMRPIVVQYEGHYEIGRGPINRWKLRTPDLFLAYSDSIAGHLQSGGVPKSKIKTVSNGAAGENKSGEPDVFVKKIVDIYKNLVAVR